MLTLLTPSPADYHALAELWEASVRATHDFLDEATILALRPSVEHDYFPQVTLRACRSDDGHWLGFVGVAEGKIEMLFVAPAARGQGVGSQLLQYAVDTLHATQVDVNEQNPQAVGFYLHHGFVRTGRSALDGQGRPFPLLHLQRA